MASDPINQVPARFVFKDDHFGPRVSDMKNGRWMSADLVREMYEAIPRRKRKADALASRDEALATPPAAIPAAPSEVTDAQIIEWAIEEQFLLFCDEEDVVQIVRSAFQKWPTLAALTQPTTVQQAQRVCGNPDCGWKGHTNRMLGSIGPLCPECGETTEENDP